MADIIEIGKRIKLCREQRGMTQGELGERLGLNKSTIQRYETGQIAKIKLPILESMAAELEVNAEYLALKNDDPKIKKDPIESNATILPQTDIRMIPLYESVSAGFGAVACDCIIDYIPTVIHNPYEADETIAIIVSGDSMYPKIEDGDTIVVHKQTSVDSGQIAVVLIDGEDAVVKKVKYGADWVDLISINPEYKTRHFEKEELERLRVLGLVRQIIKMV